MFAERLRKLRQERRMSREALGKLLGVSATAVYKWETAQSEPDMDTLGRLATMFSVTLDDLCGREPPADENARELARMVTRMSASERAQLIALSRTLYAHAFEEAPGGQS